MRSTSNGNDPPLVSQSTRHSAPACGRRFEHTQRELGVVAVAVEEVLGIEEHAQAVALQERDRISDHRHAFGEIGTQRFGDVVVPRLADDAHRRRARLDEIAQRRVVVDLALDTAGGPERHQRRRVELQLGRGAPEELFVLRVGARPAAFDVVDAQVVELLGDAQLVLDRQRDAFELRAVAQRRVVDLDLSRCLLVRFTRRHVRPNPCSDRPGPGPPSCRCRRSTW